MGSILGLDTVLAPVLAADNADASAAGGNKVTIDGATSKDSTSMWKQFGNGIVGIFTGIRPFVIALVVAALIINGIGCIIGGEQSREKFKHAMPWVLVGAVVILLSLSIATGVIEGMVGTDNSISTIMPVVSTVFTE